MGDDGLPDAVPGLRPHPEVGRKMNLEWWKHTNLRGPTVDPAAAMKEMRRKVAAVAAEVGKPTDGAAPPPAAAAPAAAEEGGVPPRGDLANAIRAMGRDLQDQAELALLGPRVAASAATLVEAAGEVLPGDFNFLFELSSLRKRRKRRRRRRRRRRRSSNPTDSAW